METEARRHLIRQKLSDGRLPQNSISRVSGRPSEGEICHACEGIIAEADMVIEGIFQGSVTPLQLDVDCFYLWYAERGDAGVTVRGESASDTPVPATDTAVPRTRLSLEDVRVLIVDSDEMAVYSWTRYLETLGARVTSATDGREALTILRQDTIDVLVADLMLPGIDGFHLAQAASAGQAHYRDSRERVRRWVPTRLGGRFRLVFRLLPPEAGRPVRSRARNCRETRLTTHPSLLPRVVSQAPLGCSGRQQCSRQ